MHTATDAEASTFEEYAAATWPALYRSAYLLAGNHADAEDVAQQTLIKAHRNWSRVIGSDSPNAYVRRILTNTYLSSVRPQKRRLEVLTDAPPDPVPGIGPSATSRREDQLALWPHVRDLPPRQRAVIVLRYFEDLSEADIARVLDCSRGNVKSTAHRALHALRAAIGSAGTDREED